MKPTFRARLFRLLPSLLLLGSLGLHADISHSISSLTLPGFTGYVIDSDAGNNGFGYDRESIPVQAVVNYQRAAGNAEYIYEYTYQYRLLDENGTAQPLRVGLTTSTVQTSTVTINRSQQFVIYLPVTNSVSLTPAESLDPYKQHRVEVKLLRRVSGSIGRATDTGASEQTPLQSVYHFTSTNPLDSNYNAIPVLNAVSWTRRYAVDTDPDKDAFQVTAGFRVLRYDGWTLPRTTNDITFRVTAELRDAATDELVAISPASSTHVRGIPNFSFNIFLGYTFPTVVDTSAVFSFRPVDGTRLDPVNKTYRMQIRLGHYQTPTALLPLAANELPLAASRLLHFSGNLRFGDIPTRFTSIANNPSAGALSGGGVNTSLAVDGGSGSVVDHPGHTYGDGTALAVSLRPNGDAWLSAGSVTLSGPTPDDDVAGRVRFRRGPITLDTDGASALLAAFYPTGFGLALNTATKMLNGVAGFLDVPLTPDLQPATDPVTVLPSPWWGADESRPVWMEVSDVRWIVASSRFEFAATGRAEYVRRHEYEALNAAPVSAAAKAKKSNERYYEWVDTVLSDRVVIDAEDGAGGGLPGASLLTVGLGFKPGAFITHFPLGSAVGWAGAGEQWIERDLVLPGTSFLSGVSQIRVAYSRDCLEMGCGSPIGAAGIRFIPGDDRLRFTPDGGLHADGTLTTATNIQWGWISEPGIQKFAQQTAAGTPWKDSGFLMSGTFLNYAQSPGSHLFHKPGVILFTGFSAPGASNRLERPKTAPYQEGFADYAGLNFRVGSDGALKGRSTIAGKDTGDYPLTGRSKYYIRPAGVSGIHEAVFGQFPESFTLYGYPVNFDNYGLSYLDSQNVDSRTEGHIRVPGPSNFQQNFEELTLGCLGELKDAKVPASEAGVAKVLEYWQADFVTQSIQFDRKAANSCDPGSGVLVLGVDAYAVHVDATLHGLLGFHPSGNLITRADCEAPNGPLDPPFDSRLKLPNQFTLAGPKDEKYAVTPVTDAYLSNWDNRNGNKDAQGALRPGFVNFAATLDVPFFEDLKVHVHTSANKEQTSAPIQLMGGWPDKGFRTAGKDFFNDKSFDRDNVGFPGDVTNLEYENGKESLGDKYRVRAVRSWLDLVTFEIPLDWSSSTRAFTTYKPVTTDLVVISAEYQAKYLSAVNAELAFGVQYEGMPQINLENLVFDQLGGLQDAFQDVVQAQLIDRGFDALNSLIAPNLQDVLDPVFDRLLDPVVDNLFNALSANFDAATKQWVAPPLPIVQQYCGLIGGVPNNFSDLLENKLLGDVGAGAKGLVKEIEGRLKDAEDGIGQIEALLAEAGDGNRQLITKLLRQLVQTLVSQATDSPIAQSLAGFAAELAGGALDPQLNEFLKKADPTLDEIHNVLATLKGTIGQARGVLATGQEFEAELKSKLNQLVANNEVVTTLTKACNDITAHLATFQAGIDNPFTPAASAQLKALIRQKINDRVLGSAIPTAFTSILKQRLYDLESGLHEATDSLFQQVNTILRDTLSGPLSGIDNSINGFLGDLGSSMGAGRLNGYAHIVGDSLKELRIDLYAQFKVPSEMEFNAYLQIRELDSESEENGCIAPGQKATEVRIGATDVDLNFISTNLRASVEAKFTFRTEPSFAILGAGAGIDLDGELSFATFKITHLGAQMAFGLQENYFSGACALEFNSYKAKGGIFFGRTCTLDPFFWDPDVQGLIGKPPFTGIYAYGEVWIPVSEALLGIPATCFFEVSAGVGLGAGFFIEGPTFVGKMLLGCSGSVLCLASLEGEVKLVGVKNADGLQLKGSGRLEGCLGPCPFCLCASKTVAITYKNNKWDVDF